MIDQDIEEMNNYDNRQVFGIVISTRSFENLSDFEMIMGYKGQSATFNQAKEMLANNFKVYYVDLISNAPQTNGNMYVLGKYRIQNMEPFDKIKNFTEYFSESKLDNVKALPIKDKIFTMDPSYTFHYYWQWLPRNQVTLSEHTGLIKGLCSRYLKKRNLKVFIRAVGAIIDLRLPVEEIFKRLSKIKCELDIINKNTGKIYNYTNLFFASLNIENILDNQFVDLPDIELKSKEVGEEYVQLIIELGKAMKVAVMYEWKEQLINPLPNGFQDFSVLDRQYMHVM